MSLFAEAIQRGNRASQPLATAVVIGTLYYVTDENVTERSNGTTWQDFSDAGTGGGGGAPTTVDYLVKTADAGLSAERVVTDTPSITVDWATGGQAKFQRAALTGDVTASADSNSTTIGAGKVTEAMQVLADNTTQNVSTSAHGYAPKLTAPSAGIRNILKIDNGETALTAAALFDNTNPADLSTAGPGTSLIAARRDHIHNTPAGGSGALTLIEHKTFTANATTYTFSGLDGNTDGEWLLKIKLRNNFGNSVSYFMRPNGATTNLSSAMSWSGQATSSSTGTTAQIGFDSNGTPPYMSMDLSIFPRKNPHSIASPLSYHGVGGTRATSFFTIVVAGLWNETATNVTSLEILGDQTNGLGDGTEMWLYKVGQ